MRAVSGESLPIDRKSRARAPSLQQHLRPVEERLCDFDNVILPMTPEEAMYEASRCIQCPDPAPCVQACPAHNDIPSAMWLIEEGKFLEAAQLYRQTSSMPEICGQVCPQEQLCQGSCSHLKSHASVMTGPLEAFVTLYERETVGVKIPIGTPTGKRVAIVGSGPAGLACADQLVRAGHKITIFESKPAPGGLLTYGIPNFKLPKDVVFSLICDLREAGVEMVFNTYIGKDKTIDDLFMEGYDAVFVGVGTEVDAPMEVPGEDLLGVYKATEFLARAALDVDMLPPDMRSRPEIGKKVVVIGGVIRPRTACEPHCVSAPKRLPACTGARSRRCQVACTIVSSLLRKGRTISS
jgi:glutamate synthase (NADPH) small chain